jgi:hypothetical protein
MQVFCSIVEGWDTSEMVVRFLVVVIVVIEQEGERNEERKKKSKNKAATLEVIHADPLHGRVQPLDGPESGNSGCTVVAMIPRKTDKQPKKIAPIVPSPQCSRHRSIVQSLHQAIPATPIV